MCVHVNIDYFQSQLESPNTEHSAKPPILWIYVAWARRYGYERCPPLELGYLPVRAAGWQPALLICLDLPNIEWVNIRRDLQDLQDSASQFHILSIQSINSGNAIPC